MYSAVATPSSASIGLGTLSGTVGLVESNVYLTISNAGVKMANSAGNPLTWLLASALLMLI